MSAVEMEEKNKSSRRTWSAEETKAFLDAYGKRRFEFESAKLKKFAMKNVLEDLIALGVLTQPTSEDMLKVKLKNLLRAYKTANDTNKRTGESPIKAPFEDQMDEIFGSQPIIKNNHAINLCGKEIEPLQMECSFSNTAMKPTTVVPSPTVPTMSTITVTSKEQRKKTAKQKYYEMRDERAAERNKILMEYTAKKLKKMDEAEQRKEARFIRKENLIKELFNKT